MAERAGDTAGDTSGIWPMRVQRLISPIVRLWWYGSHRQATGMQGLRWSAKSVRRTHPRE